MERLFGTDGIRGVANEHPITCEMAVKLGRSVAHYFKTDGTAGRIVIGTDTRLSRDMISHGLVSGITSMGVAAVLVDILPTPAVAYLTASQGASAGIVVSASHNPYHDNGIKIFNHRGFKLSDDVETALEQLVLSDESARQSRAVRGTGRLLGLDNAGEMYRRFLIRALPDHLSLRGLNIVLDCANGATYQVAPRLFSDLGANVTAMNVQPDGRNINRGCGSEHPGSLVQMVQTLGADIGLAFDGDGDRLIAADETGDLITGDRIMAICGAFFKKEKGALKNNLVVSTVMSNLGLGLALKAAGIRHAVTDVGDRYVAQKMIEEGAVLGGEDSGHMIFLDHHTTGDGLLTALRLIEVMQSTSKPLSELKTIMDVYPQALINVAVKAKPALARLPKIGEAIREVEAQLGEWGRVLVRYSGTQPICRVMVEARTAAETERCSRRIADVIQKEIGA